MSYIEGFVAAVPTANKEKYKAHAKQAFEAVKALGATRMVECWGNDVPTGETTDFASAVKAKADETIVFSWIEYPDKTTRDAANKTMHTPEFGESMGEMPFDGKRMIFGGFEVLLNCEA